MAVFWKIVSRKDPSTGKSKWFPILSMLGKRIGTRSVAKRISELSALSQGDVYDVLINLGYVIKQFLQESHTVKLEGLGTFFYRISEAKGETDAAKVSPTSGCLRMTFLPERFHRFGGRNNIPIMNDIEFQFAGYSRSRKVIAKLHDFERRISAVQVNLGKAQAQLAAGEADAQVLVAFFEKDLQKELAEYETFLKQYPDLPKLFSTDQKNKK